MYKPWSAIGSSTCLLLNFEIGLRKFGICLDIFYSAAVQLLGLLQNFTFCEHHFLRASDS